MHSIVNIFLMILLGACSIWGIIYIVAVSTKLCIALQNADTINDALTCEIHKNEEGKFLEFPCHICKCTCHHCTCEDFYKHTQWDD